MNRSIQASVHMRTSFVKTALLAAIRQEFSQVEESQLPQDVHEQRDMLGDVLIQSNTNWKEETLRLIDQVWATEKSEVVTLEQLKSSAVYRGTDLIVWQGDITALEVDAIVNAANSQGLGCFVPSHKCVDNVIHRKAGPRLRIACRQAMQERRSDLRVGTPPIVTDGFFLPAGQVIHVTGPQIDGQGDGAENITEREQKQLAFCYQSSLDAASVRGLRSIAFPGISTGLFGFPKDRAATIAVETVKGWLDVHRDHKFEAIVFDTFTKDDEALYLNQFAASFGPLVSQTALSDIRTTTIRLAKQWIDEANAVLICAGAGMSGNEGELVYTNATDFADHYPWFLKWGYRTAYEAMGLLADRSVPDTALWAFEAKHMDNMRWTFAPNEGYLSLKELVHDKDYFVLTSNVDACFERSGFSPDRIYTPQGEWTYMQCLTPCYPDSVFETRPFLDKALPEISEDGFIPEELVPKCPNCGGPVFGNVRGGSWFLHNKYEAQNIALQDWMRQVLASGKRIVVIEIGAGFNTPMVTRFPVESFVRDAKETGRMIRINPSDAEVPSDLQAISIPEGWTVLQELVTAAPLDPSDSLAAEERAREHQRKQGLVRSAALTARLRQYFGHFDRQQFLDQLRD